MALLAVAGTLAAQQSSIVTFDLNGHSVPGPSIYRVATPSGERQVRTTRSINGRAVPVESSEDRVLSKSPSGEVIERTIVRYDADGNPGPPEKVRIERATLPGGTETVRTTTWRADLNGNFSLTERSRSEKSAQGTMQTWLERPSGNDGMELVARIDRTERGGRSETVEYRRDTNGAFVEASREVSTTSQAAGRQTTETVRFDDGSSEPASRTVARRIERPDGSVVEDVDIYSRLGVAASTEPQLQRQVRYEERPAGGGKVVVTSVRPNPDATFEKLQETRIEGGTP